MLLNKIGCIFSNLWVLPYIIGAYAWWEFIIQKRYKPVLWLTGLLVLIAGMNILLKNLFQIPLCCDPVRYGFPSGHLLSLTTLYGWICFSLSQDIDMSVYKKPIKQLLKTIAIVSYITILILVSRWIVYMRFHTWFDVLGGMFFGTLILNAAILTIKYKPILLD